VGISSESEERSLNHVTVSISSVAHAGIRDRDSINVFSKGIVVKGKEKVE